VRARVLELAHSQAQRLLAVKQGRLGEILR
jgi:hypothetical protein